MDEQEPSDTPRGRRLLFLDRPPQSPEELDQWATELAERLWPVIEQVRRQAGEAVDSELPPPVG